MNIFQEHFYDNRNNWCQQNNSESQLKVEQGVYTINHFRQSGYYGTWHSVDINENQLYTIQTWMQITSANIPSRFGVIWGVGDINNFHYFLISSSYDKYWIGTIANGQDHIYGGSGYLPMALPQFAKIIFTISHCSNGMVKFLINNQEFQRTYARPLYGKGIGFYVGPAMAMRALELSVRSVGLDSAGSSNYGATSFVDADIEPKDTDFTGPPIYQTSSGKFTTDHNEWSEDQYNGGRESDPDYWITHSGDE